MLDRPAVIYHYDGTFAGFLSCVFESYAEKEMPIAIVPADESDQTSLFGAKYIETDLKRAQRVRTAVPQKLGLAANELLARVRAMLRRKEQYHSDVMEFEGLKLNISTFELGCGSENTRLVSKEFQLMQLLMQSPGSVISTEQFMERIWGWDSEVDVSVVWVYISNLRKKIDRLGAPVNIRAVRGVGYCLERIQK